MYIKSKTSYDRFHKKKVPFLRREDGKIFNGEWDVTDSSEFLHGIRTGEEEIHLKDYLVYRPLPPALMKLGTMPDVHPKSYEMQIWYRKIYLALTEGVTVGREYYNPFFVFWILIFIFEIPLYDKHGNPIDGSKIDQPLYSNIDRYMFDIFWKAFKQRKYVALMSGRGLGKSFITSSIEAWYYVLFDDQEIIVSATSDPIVEEAWTKTTDTFDLIEKKFPGFRQKRILNSNTKIKAGEEYYDANNDLQVRGSQNDVRRIVYGDNSNKTRGRRPHFQHVEEFAAFPSHPSKGSLKNVIGQSKGSWLVMGSFKKAFVVFTGTGGSVNNKDAEDVFTNPRGYNLIEVNEWGKATSLFIPTFLKYGGTWEPSGVPDIARALDMIVERRKDLESDPVAYMKELQEFPIDLEEVFIVHGTNIFNQDKIAEQIAKAKMAKELPYETGNLEYVLDGSGNVEDVKFVKKADGDFIIVEHPQKEADGKLLNNLYVAGVDSIDQGKADSLYDGSKFAMVVKKRISGSMFAQTSNLYVAYYNKRSDQVRWDYDNALKLSMYYNARINLEYTKINIISHFRERGQLWRFLQRPSIAIGSNVSGAKASTLIGSPATAHVIAHQDQKLADYIDDYYYQLVYLEALEQLRDYSMEARTKFDYVVAMGLAELADEDFLGKPATPPGAATEDLTDFGFYRDEKGIKRWGEIPKKNEELKSIAEEVIQEEIDDRNNPFTWVESTSSRV